MFLQTFLIKSNWRKHKLLQHWSGFFEGSVGQNRNYKFWNKTANTREILDFKLSPCPECCTLSFGWFPGVWILHADVSEHSVRSIFTYTHLPAYEDGSVPKRRHIKFRRRGITQKKAYNKGNCFVFIRESSHRQHWLTLQLTVSPTSTNMVKKKPVRFNCKVYLQNVILKQILQIFPCHTVINMTSNIPLNTRIQLTTSKHFPRTQISMLPAHIFQLFSVVTLSYQMKPLRKKL